MAFVRFLFPFFTTVTNKAILFFGKLNVELPEKQERCDCSDIHWAQIVTESTILNLFVDTETSE